MGDVEVKKTASYADQQTGNYMTNGPTEEYKSGVTNLHDLIAKIRAKDEALLVEVQEKYEKEHKEFDDERNTEIARSKKVLADLLAKLQGIVDAARAERDAAETARAAQEQVRIAAEADFTAKDAALVAAQKLEAAEVAA